MGGNFVGNVGEGISTPGVHNALMILTVSDLIAIVPELESDQHKANLLVGALIPAINWYEIDQALRLAAFLAQIAHETGAFKWIYESGKASYFRKYEDRSDLGNTQKGDGERFKGRGFLMLTGRANYLAGSAEVGVDLIAHPELAEGYNVAAMVAGWFWKKRGLNELADNREFEKITRKINGGLSGYQSRLRYYKRALKVFGADAMESHTTNDTQKTAM